MEYENGKLIVKTVAIEEQRRCCKCWEKERRSVSTVQIHNNQRMGSTTDIYTLAGRCQSLSGGTLISSVKPVKNVERSAY